MPDAAPATLPRLERGVVEIFWFSTDLPAARLKPLECLLDAAERERADRFRFGRDRRRFVAARGRLRTLLGSYAERPPALLEFVTGPYGKPALPWASGRLRLQFSASRSHGVGVVAVGLEDEVGVDIERIRPFDDALAIAERMFTAEEQRALQALPEAAQSAAFFRYWTGKEAMVKSVGRGLSQPLKAFGLRLDGPSAERVELGCGAVPVTRWVLTVPPLRAGFVGALAAGGAPPTLRCRDWPGE